MSEWRTAPAPAKLNLALVVGPVRPDGKHEVVTVLERLALSDTVSVRPAASTSVAGFAGDRLVRSALDAISSAAADTIRFEARLEKRIPVAAGLGGGSSDAAAVFTSDSATSTPRRPRSASTETSRRVRSRASAACFSSPCRSRTRPPRRPPSKSGTERTAAMLQVATRPRPGSVVKPQAVLCRPRVGR